MKVPLRRDLSGRFLPGNDPPCADDIRRLRGEGKTTRQIIAVLGSSSRLVYKVARANGISFTLPVMTPAEKRAQKRDYKRWKYRTDPKYRAYVRTKSKASRDQDKINAQRKAWLDAHPGAKAEYDRKWKRLSGAIGYSPLVLKGETVTAPYLPGEWRVLNRYVVDGEAVCDLDNGFKTIEECPIGSLTLKK